MEKLSSMGTIEQKFDKLVATKTAIHLAIEAKGVDVPHGTAFGDYPGYIAAIETGTGQGGGGIPATGQDTSVVSGDDGDLKLGYSKALTVSRNITSVTGMEIAFVKNVCKIFPGDSGETTGGSSNWSAAQSYAKGLVVNADITNINAPSWQNYGTYSLNDVVGSYGYRFVCKLAHTASNYEPGNSSSGWATYWNTYSSVDWATNVLYEVNDIVKISSSLYTCILEHTSAYYSPIYGDGGGKWTKYDSVVNAWEYNQAYTTSSYVFQYGVFYHCILAHTSTYNDDYPPYGAAWQTYWEEVTAPADWSYGSTYTSGTWVKYWDNASYYVRALCTADHVASYHYPGMDADWQTYWDSISTVSWSTEVDYETNDLVYVYDGNTYNFYQCSGNHRSSNHEPPYTSDYSTYWTDETTSGWLTGTLYAVDTYVYYYDGNISKNFKCILEHTSGNSTIPGVGADWKTYWQLLPKAVVAKSAHTSALTNEPYYGANWETYWIGNPWLESGLSLTTPAQCTWIDYIEMCNSLSYGGFTDWRMPNLFEMQLLLNYDTYNSMIDPAYATNLQGYYWTSTAYAAYPGNAWKVSMYDGSLSSDGITNPVSSTYCIPVRSL